MEIDEIRRHAEAREQLHAHHASCRPLSEGYEVVGIAGEVAFAEWAGVPPDLRPLPGGDGGKDLTITLTFTVNVKTSRKPYHLLHEEGKKFADIFVLAGFADETSKVQFLGWEWGARFARAPVKDFGWGVRNHYIHASQLRPMSELDARLYRHL